jgi:hypothetical protein
MRPARTAAKHIARLRRKPFISPLCLRHNRLGAGGCLPPYPRGYLGTEEGPQLLLFPSIPRGSGGVKPPVPGADATPRAPAPARGAGRVRGSKGGFAPLATPKPQARESRA